MSSDRSKKSIDAVTIQRIDRDSDHLSDVIDLGDANSATLGHFPRGAFEEYAERGNIFIALDEEDSFLGYILYRTSRQKVIIVHLCVREEYRRLGIASQLVDRLSQETQEYLGIGLRCRRDYDAHDVWPQLGFTPRFEEQGRSKKGSVLTFWWIDHHKRDLFSQVDKNRPDESLDVAIDANIFYDLEFSDDRDSKESLSLVADWIQSHLNIHLTEEIFSEIDRLETDDEREEKRKVAREYPEIECKPADFTEIRDTLYSFEPLIEAFSDPLDEQDKSDIRHLARTIGAGVLFFVTRDNTLLSVSDALYEEYGITVLRPANLVTRLDQLYGEVQSQPKRLAGTLIEVQAATQYQEENWTDKFFHHSTSEKKSEFKRKIRKYTSDPKTYTCKLVLGEKEPLAFIVYDRHCDSELRVPFLRLADTNRSLTVGYHLVFNAVRSAAHENRRYVVLTDSFLNPELVSSLPDDGFVKTTDGWSKTSLPVVTSSSQFANLLRRVAEDRRPPASDHHVEMAGLIEKSSKENSAAYSLIEKRFWPAKIADADIPTYIVAIKPEWARHLVDERLSRGDLFGAEQDLALNREGVYYRSKRGGSKIHSPGRILWYVSNDRNISGSKHLRACSRLEEVAVEPPKDLYRRFRRLGVYEWKHVFKTANEDTGQEIMALKFSDTEHFDNPIPWKDMQAILKDEGIKTTVQSPTRITSEAFVRLYTTGKNIHS